MSEVCCTRLADDAKNRRLGTIPPLCPAISSQLRLLSTIGKINLLNSNTSCTCPHNVVNFGPLTVEICWRDWATPANSSGFAFRLRYCTDITQRRSSKFCRMFGRLLGWYTTYTFWELLPPNGILPAAKITASKSCVLLYWQRYCMALEQRRSAKLCGVVQGMGLRNFRRRRHLCSAGRPSSWASAHILVLLLGRIAVLRT